MANVFPCMAGVQVLQLTPTGELQILDLATNTYTTFPTTTEDERRKVDDRICRTAIKVGKPVYFATHTCTLDQLNVYIDEDIRKRWVSDERWRKKVGLKLCSQMNCDVLLRRLTRGIMPHWRSTLPNYPNQADKCNLSPTELTAFLEQVDAFFDAAVELDPSNVEKFYSPLFNTINWPRICWQETDEDVRAYEWGMKCFREAVKKAWELGLDGSVTDTSKLGKLCRKRNDDWKKMGDGSTIGVDEVRLVRAGDDDDNSDSEDEGEVGENEGDDEGDEFSEEQGDVEGELSADDEEDFVPTTPSPAVTPPPPRQYDEESPARVWRMIEEAMSDSELAEYRTRDFYSW